MYLNDFLAEAGCRLNVYQTNVFVLGLVWRAEVEGPEGCKVTIDSKPIVATGFMEWEAIECLAHMISGKMLSVGGKDFSAPKKLALEGVTDDY